MAIKTVTSSALHRCRAAAHIPTLERLARAVFGGPRCAAAAVTDAARGLLSCDAALVLQPAASADILACTYIAGGDGARRDLWHLGPRAPRLFDRLSHTADGWREPWSGLRAKLRSHGIRSWAAVPLRDEGRLRPLGLLVVGSNDAGDYPCGRLDHLPDVALSATAALSAAAGADAPGAGTAELCGDPPSELRASRTLTFGVSHTLGNIFGAVVGNLHFLREAVESSDARELIARVEESTAEGVELIRALQAYTATPATAPMEALDLSEIAREVSALARRLTGHWPGQRGIQIETDLTSGAPTWGDARRLRETVTNVVFNAIEAVGGEGRIMLRTGCDGRFSELRVIDDGPGMTDEVWRRATEPFFTTGQPPHEGLGLTVARGVAVDHRGSLTLHHGRARGTEVALRLPQEAPHEEVTGHADRPLHAASPVAGHRKEQRR